MCFKRLTMLQTFWRAMDILFIEEAILSLFHIVTLRIIFDITIWEFQNPD
ncbi:hypothetical protein LINPERHAP2_LOCUS21750 [Linum perenne]